MKKIAIIGGLGYVGRFLTQYLSKEFEVVVFGRKNIEILKEEIPNVSYQNAESGYKNDFDVVINLAYADTYGRKRNFIANKNIVHLAQSLAKTDTLIIHASTLSVFGIDLENKPIAEPIRMKRDMYYIETKIHIEKLFEQQFKNNLHIIRFGNVFGPGSGWLIGPLNRILYGHAFPEAAKSAFSNITDVANICDFMHFLIMQPPFKATQYHHLAEFYKHSWAEIIDILAKEIHAEPLYRPFHIEYPSTFRAELQSVFNPVMPRSLFDKMLKGRKLASLMNTLVDITPPRVRQLGKNVPTPVYSSNAIADVVFSCQRPFEVITPNSWQPKKNFEEVMQTAMNYMKDSGYLVE